MSNEMTSRNGWSQNLSLLGLYVGWNCEIENCGYCFKHRLPKDLPVLDGLAERYMRQEFDIAAVVGMSPYAKGQREIALQIMKQIPCGVITDGAILDSPLNEAAEWIDVTLDKRRNNFGKSLLFLEYIVKFGKSHVLIPLVPGVEDWLPAIMDRLKGVGVQSVCLGNVHSDSDFTMSQGEFERLIYQLGKGAGRELVRYQFDTYGRTYDIEHLQLPVEWEIPEKNRHMTPDGVIHSGHPVDTFKKYRYSKRTDWQFEYAANE